MDKSGQAGRNSYSKAVAISGLHRHIMQSMSRLTPEKPALLLLAALIAGIANAADYKTPGLTPEQLLDMQDNNRSPLVVDERKPAEFGAAHVPGEINIPLAEVEERLDEFKHDNGALLYCINGSRTRKAEAILLEAGIADIYHLEGTFSGCIQGKHPVEKGGVKKSW